MFSQFQIKRDPAFFIFLFSPLFSRNLENLENEKMENNSLLFAPLDLSNYVYLDYKCFSRYSHRHLYGLAPS